MKIAPVQLLQTRFRKVCIEVDERHVPTEPPNPLTTVFDFNGVTFKTEVSLGFADPNHQRGKVYFISLKLIVDNEVTPDVKNQKFSPYLLDVHVDALVLIPRESEEKYGNPEDLAIVNGASFAWGAAREQIINVTSRMQVGSVTLPSMSFHGLKEDNGGSAPPEKSADVARAATVKAPAKKK